MKMKTLAVGLALFALGAALGYWLSPQQAVKPSAAETETPRPKKAIADRGDAASQMALRARIRELEAQLRERAAQTNAVAAVPQQEFGRGGPREGFRERMERLQKENPERFAEITNNMARWRQHRSERQRARMEYLASIDTSRMSVAARGVHKSLQDQIAYREELEQRLQDPDLDESERRELMDKMRESHRQIRALNGVERNNLIEQTAQTLGFEGQDVKDISQTMREIIDATDNGHGGPPGGPGGPGGPGPGAPPPR